MQLVPFLDKQTIDDVTFLNMFVTRTQDHFKFVARVICRVDSDWPKQVWFEAVWPKQVLPHVVHSVGVGSMV